MVPFALVLDLRFLGKVAPSASWLGPTDKLNTAREVVIWKRLVTKGCRGMGLGRDGAEMAGEAGAAAPSGTNFPARTQATATRGSKESFAAPPSQRYFQELYFSCQLAKEQKRNNRFKLK